VANVLIQLCIINHARIKVICEQIGVRFMPYPKLNSHMSNLTVVSKVDSVNIRGRCRYNIIAEAYV